MAKAGSCNIGFNPKPSSGTGKIILNGFETVNKNIINPKTIISWKIIVKIIYFFGWFFDFKEKIKINKTKTNNQRSKLPSWLPQDPETL